MKRNQMILVGWSRLLPVLLAYCAQAQGASSFDGSTSLRVLLDERPALKVRALQGKLYLHLGGRWYHSKKAATIQCEKPNTLRVNGKSFPPPLRLRGGPKLTDPVLVDQATAKYPGELVIRPTPKGCLVVNHVPFDLYLQGTLAAEVVPSWPLEALKAQAVASRTYALKRKLRPIHRHYDIQNTVLDQVYDGIGPYASIQKAVDETSGQVLYYQGKLAQIYFHSSCGGQTTSEGDVWDAPNPSHISVPCPYCKSQPHLWETTLSLKDDLGLPPRGQSFSLNRSPESPGERWHELSVTLGKSTQRLSGDALRKKVGYGRLRSTLLKDWKVQNDSLIVSGRGAGHGVGMCQWGAQHLARKGKTFQSILKHYYPQLSLKTTTPPKKKGLDFYRPQG